MLFLQKLNSQNSQKISVGVFAFLLFLWLIIDLGARIGGEVLWFQEVGYLSVFRIRLITQAILFAIVFLLSTIYLFGNLSLARRLRYYQSTPLTQKTTNLIRRDFHQPIITKYRFIPLRLRGLLIAGSGCIALLALLFAYYGQVAGSSGFNGTTLSQFTVSSIPSLFKSNVSWPSVQQSLFSARFLIGLLIGSIALLLYPQILLSTIAVAITILMSFGIARRWGIVLQALHPTAFGQRDPLFDHDISTYFFSLPIWELSVFCLVGVSVTGIVLVILTYLFSGNSLSEGNFPGFSSQQQRHLFGLGAVLMLAIALSFWLGRYELLYSPRGVSYGASYTDVAVQLPAYTVLSILALFIAGYLCWQTLVRGQKQSPNRWLLPLLGLYLAIALIAGILAPILVQALVVQPNELAREQPFIQRTIAFTRRAFGLEAIDTRNFNPQGQLTQADLKTNDLTIRNIRLWDQQPLLETNRQLQQIRSYYRFPDADIDRYTFLSDAKANPPTLSKQQVLISPRELDYQAVPKQAQTWINKHLIYTHGYGFTLSPVNRVGPGGLPDYFVKDIGITEGTPLTTSSEAVRASIPIGQPRIYYGELTNTYVMTRTKVKELDYPSGNDNVYNTYDGLGGINLGTTWRRWLFAKYLNDWRTIFTPEFLPDTKLMFRRNITQRVQAIAPFLRYDSDPYLIAADATPGKPSSDPSYLYWIIDAYTTSDRYPYSDVGKEGINYIRNSVKVVVDAYHGSVDFYISDPSDPMIRTWSAIFPNLLKPLSAMPNSLRNHLRYPVDFFKLQSDRLLTYHMTDPQVFYNREDQWQIPTEVYGSKPRLVEPYYLITSLPTVPYEEFILLLPYTPKERTNLIAWLAARSDGKNYGKLLLYVFPKQRLVYGPEQIEARINQDPVISQQISLWNREGSRVIQGNLLIIPIEQSLLYVEPLYLEATQNQLPTLVRVIVAYENRIVMAQTLEQALTGIFQGETVTPPIVRSVETEAP
jgi:uncharacterized protein